MQSVRKAAEIFTGYTLRKMFDSKELFTDNYSYFNVLKLESNSES